MIITKKVTAKRIDIYEPVNGKYIGDASCGNDGVFQWFPIFNSTPVFGAALLHAVANLIDSLNAESTNQSNGNPPTATD